MVNSIRVSGTGVGDKEKGINEIKPYLTASQNRTARGGDSTGVICGFEVVGNNIRTVTIRPGVASAWGYDIFTDEDVNLSGNIPAAGDKYIYILASIDLSNIPAVFNIELHDNGNNPTFTPTPQDDLISNPSGRHKLILHRLKVNTSGTITEKLGWRSFGVKTLSMAENAKHADVSNSYESGGGIDTALKNIKADFVAADAAIITRLENLGFKTGSVSGITGTTLSKVGTYAIWQFPCGINLPGGSMNINIGFSSLSTIKIPVYTDNFGVTLSFTAGSNVVRYDAARNPGSIPSPLIVSIGFLIQN